MYIFITANSIKIYTQYIENKNIIIAVFLFLKIIAQKTLQLEGSILGSVDETEKIAR